MSDLKFTKVWPRKTGSIALTVFFFTSSVFSQKHFQVKGRNVHSQGAANLINPVLVDKFYELTNNRLVWFLPGNDSYTLRETLKNKTDSSTDIGLQKARYHFNELNEITNKTFRQEDSLAAMNADRIFTDAAITYCKDIYQGINIDDWLSFDELSPMCDDADNVFILSRLAALKSGSDLQNFLELLEPVDNEYLVLKNELLTRGDSLSHFQKKQLSSSINFCRWVHHFKFEKRIVVNIASATLKYYEYDSLQLTMKVVVGKPSTRTPRFSTYCNQVILYPYWNVPASIALNELLPQFKRNPDEIDELNIQLISSNGTVVDHHKLEWKNYSKNYFPFRMRQSTGCDNSLGVMKFNLTSPLGVYLHDTNNKLAFLWGFRYHSHGCIRVEKPIELSNYLLVTKVDSTFLKSCVQGQVPIPLNLVKPVPVFVIYQMAGAGPKSVVTYYKDVYSLLK